MIYLKYLSYVIKHKWYVFVECCKLGIPLRGILHDMSKLLPSEFFPYANYFYGKEDEDSFDRAWLSHQHRNKHHWQWWVLNGDDGWTKVLPMDLKYCREMVADWRGAGRAISGNDDSIEWYTKNKSKMQLHADTIKVVEDMLRGVYY